MVFVETTAFTKLLPSYLSDEEYVKLQLFLLEFPESGDIIKGTGGLRKLRWRSKNQGKRGGLRIIYYWYPLRSAIYFFTLYQKNEMADLSEREKNILKSMLERCLL